MPLRVKCRCGQEVVVRSSESQHLVAGLLVISLLVNVVTLVIVISRPGVAGRSIETSGVAPRPAAGPVARSGDSGGPGAVSGAHPVVSIEGASGSLAADGEAPPAVAEPQTGAAPHDGAGQRQRVEVVGEPERALPDPISLQSVKEQAPLAPELAVDPDEAFDTRAERPPVESVVEAHRVESDGDEPGSAPEASTAVDANAPDSDAESSTESEPAVEDHAGGHDAERPSRLVRVVGEAVGARSSSLRDRALQVLSERVTAFEGKGIDVVLAIDVSESMDEYMLALKESAARFVRSLAWAFPSARLGVVLYRDDIVVAADLDAGSERALDAIERMEASGGGGDVPEGVYRALAGALQLGRMSWRRDAHKIVFVVGDAPPRYESVKPLLSLAGQARSEADYVIHALGLRVWDGWDGVPFFAELARAGGGQGVTIAPSAFFETAFLLCLPEESRVVVRRALPSIEKLF